MVMTIVPFNKRGRPWSDHGQTMVNSWSFCGRPWSWTMIDHGQNMVDHGLTMILPQGYAGQISLCHAKIEKNILKSFRHDQERWGGTIFGFYGGTQLL